MSAHPIQWKQESRKLSELKDYHKNPRKIGGKEFEKLQESIKRFGLAEPLVINTDNVVIGGHARKLALTEAQFEDVPVWVPDRVLTEKEVEELNIRLNRNIAGQFDFDILANEFDAKDLVEYGFEPAELGLTADFDPTSFDSDDSLDQQNLKEITCPHCGEKFTN